MKEWNKWINELTYYTIRIFCVEINFWILESKCFPLYTSSSGTDVHLIVLQKCSPCITIQMFIFFLPSLLKFAGAGLFLKKIYIMNTWSSHLAKSLLNYDTFQKIKPKCIFSLIIAFFRIQSEPDWTLYLCQKSVLIPLFFSSPAKI